MDALRRLLQREGTHISWADLTFNPWMGCTKVSPACDHCYAEDLCGNRLGVDWGPNAERRRTSVSTWAKVLRWQRVAAAAGVTLDVFCASLADVLDNHRSILPGWRRDLAVMIRQTPNLRWMLLTKRIGNAKTMLTDMFPGAELIPENVAFGITVCNQEEVERDVPKLQELKAWAEGDNGHFPKAFLSIEPQLGRIDIAGHLDLIDLVINGGESGKDARPLHPEWPVLIQQDCAAAGVAFHFKQWGEWAPVDMMRKNGRDRHVFGPGVEVSRCGIRESGRLLCGVEYQGRL